ncbi:hypothetical protein C8A01DRAFT_35704 [Parachaetomium inaequale]|uniref:WKF domain-containing protein n=1 Tax=Parachaetomium inaequale TaxID=2588326 RepID=A0AAN6SSD8_9PEZI|nr:hypothetical protein C8A01DRAFT_35704 [Parachaetomium inaequale]
MSAHVPAWKRLGLKLKGPASGEAIPSPAGPNARAKPAAQVPSAHQARVNGSPASSLKRKLPSSASTPNAASATPNKKPRRGDQSAADQGTPPSLRKSVSFADDTKASAKDKPEKKKAKKKKTTKASDAPKTDFSLEPSLNYIRQWHTARASWKFNKNHQTLLIKYLFDGDKVPSADIPIFYQYIRDLKGFVRTRLRETAAEIKQKDMDAGAGAFPAALKDKETKQKQYEETISRFLQDLHQHQQQRREPNGSASSKNANGKRTLDEVEYVLRIATPEVKQRLLKRIRAELVVDELSDSEESTATATSSTSSSSASTAAAAVDGTITTTATGRSDGSQQPAKRRRLRNVRTDIGDDDSSSSESESEESESEGSSSDSDESEDEMDVDVAPDAAAAAESSSSSSSSSEAESGSEDDDDDESGEESSSSDED